MADAFETWAEAYKKAAADGSELMWPSETLVRMFKGSYIPGLDRNYAGRKVLDIGFGNGNNLIFLATLGLELHGTEVHPDVCEQTRARLARIGYAADLKVGTNRNLPYADNTFDALVSWNVLHYENTEQGIRDALVEYRRVLKPGGRIFVSTTGPEHMILDGAATLGGHRYRIGRDDDFRKGEVFFYFDAPNYIQHYFSAQFANVLVGRTHDHLFTATLDWFVVTGTKD
jgi:ubiquinone/menaquinone biosynthesis C-methylase UbiE